MISTTQLRSAICIAACTISGAAHADVTAAQVWDDWKEQLSLYGDENVTIGAEETSSGTVTIRDVAMKFSQDGVTSQASIADITFNEISDGSVRVTMSDSYPMSIANEDFSVTLLVSQTNLEMIVSGEPDALDYNINADGYKFTLQELIVENEPIQADVEITMNDLSGTYSTVVSEMRDISYNVQIASLDMLLDFADSDTNSTNRLTFGGKIADMGMQAEMSMPLDADFSNANMFTSNDIAFTGGYILGKSDYIFDTSLDGVQTNGSLATGATTLTSTLNSSALAYDVQTIGLDFILNTTEFPMPITVSVGEYGFGVQIPVETSDEPVDFGLRIDLVDIAISDMLWNLFDGGNILPRDPLTFQLALSGTAKTLINIFDPKQTEALGNGEMPYELSSLSLDTLNVSAAGAAVTGDGAFTFDNTDMQSFAPLPRPEGEAAITISGLNALLDNLVAIGLFSAEDIMGPRMMMGMFARSTGDDQMETAVEINDKGQVFVNDNRVR